jgi:hypothetical protein
MEVGRFLKLLAPAISLSSAFSGRLIPFVKVLLDAVPRKREDVMRVFKIVIRYERTADEVCLAREWWRVLFESLSPDRWERFALCGLTCVTPVGLGLMSQSMTS